MIPINFQINPCFPGLIYAKIIIMQVTQTPLERLRKAVDDRLTKIGELKDSPIERSRAGDVTTRPVK